MPKYFLAETLPVIIGRPIRISKKAKKEDASIGWSQQGGKNPHVERFNSFFGCLKGYDFNEAMNDLRELRKEEDKRLERLVGLVKAEPKETR